MKSGHALLLALIPSASFCTPAMLPPDLGALQEWMKSEVKASASDSTRKFDTDQATHGYHVHEISDLPAPDNVKALLMESIKRRSRGTQLLPPGALPSPSQALHSISAALAGKNTDIVTSFSPADISGTELERGVLIGQEASGAIIDGISHGIERHFMLPDGSLIRLEEIDYVNAKMTLTMLRESLNAFVGPNAAISNSARSSDGQSRARLAWVTPERSYVIESLSDSPASMTSQQARILHIAEALGTR